MDGTLLQIGLLLATVVGLWVGARLLVDAVVRLARRLGLSNTVIGLTVVAVGTSTPELTVSLDATMKGFGDIAVANVLGSSVFNLAFILGVLALVRVIPIRSSLVRRDGVALLGATAVAGVFLSDLRLTRPEGAVLVGLFVLYTAYLLRGAASSEPAPSTSESSPSAEPSSPTSITRDLPEQVAFRGRDAALLIGGLALVLVSGDLMVVTASGLARGAGISEWVIGGTIVSAGTSTPEFAVSLVALRRGTMGVSVGNIVGSNVFNLLGVLGLSALLRPLAVSGEALTTFAWLAVVTVAMVAALWRGRSLSRAEGGLFTGSEAVRWALGLLG